MGKKKNRAFFICPRWNELLDGHKSQASEPVAPLRVHAKTLTAIKEGRPLARSTLRKALRAACQVWGSMFDVDAYIVDKRTTQSR